MINEFCYRIFGVVACLIPVAKVSKVLEERDVSLRVMWKVMEL